MSLNLVKNDKENKYSYSKIENIGNLYLFEIFIKKNNNKSISFRKIKSNKVDKLFSLEDRIPYNNIQKIKINVLDINNTENSAIVKRKLNKKNNSNLISHKSINIEISKITLGYAECNYQILF
jgi:hypothetical protein